MAEAHKCNCPSCFIAGPGGGTGTASFMPTTPPEITPGEECKHCYHPNEGPLYMVLRDGYVPLRCCKCQQLTTVHRGHVHELGVHHA